jgi:transposase-like protein
MDFPIVDLLDETACYRALVGWLYPDGLACPRCQARDGLDVHRRHREPVLDYQCRHCRRVFNAFTGTVFQGTHRRPSALVLVLRGIVTGEPTARIARELKASRPHLLELRHRLQDNARRAAGSRPLPDVQVEADEVYQNAGEKRPAARRRRRPATTPGQQGPGPRHLGERPAADRRGGRPRQRATAPVPGPTALAGRSGGIRRRGHPAGSARAVGPGTGAVARPVAAVFTDEWGAYASLPAEGRPHAAVHHGGAYRGDRREWARDDDGDGIREVHCNTLEGIWTGLRTFLRGFRGVSKWHLAGYLAVFQWGYNLKTPDPAFLRALLGCLATDPGT